jgi:murein DD-endopeptidase MepM/ murein hydrolase activator NlpD
MNILKMRMILVACLALAVLSFSWKGISVKVEGVDLRNMQLPFPVGESWVYNGTHSGGFGPYGGASSVFSAMDFAPTPIFPSWGSNTSNMWAVAVAPGRVIYKTSCRIVLEHEGGWKTLYYHLENPQVHYNQYVQANQRLANLANSYSEATCEGGGSTGVHLHFALIHNNYYQRLDGKRFSGWEIYAKNHINYDSSCNLVNMRKGGKIVCPYNYIKSESTTDSCNLQGDISSGYYRCGGTQKVNGVVRNGSSVQLIARETEINPDFLVERGADFHTYNI